MHRVRGMEFFSEYILIEDLSVRLAELSRDGWALDYAIPGHANIFEMDTRGVLLMIFKRPKRQEHDDD